MASASPRAVPADPGVPAARVRVFQEAAADRAEAALPEAGRMRMNYQENLPSRRGSASAKRDIGDLGTTRSGHHDKPES